MATPVDVREWCSNFRRANSGMTKTEKREQEDRDERDASDKKDGDVADLPKDSFKFEFNPKERLSPNGTSPVVYHHDVEGIDSVVKACDSEKDWEARDMLITEGKTYLALKNLWGKVMPPLLYAGEMNLNREGVIVTYEGVSLQNAGIAINDEVREKARFALRQVHDAGFLHGDLAARNIVVNQSTGAVKLIDFGLSESISELSPEKREALKQTEMESLERALDEADAES